MATATMTTQHSAAQRQERPRFTLTERELRQYSLARAILVSADNQEGSERGAGRGAERSCFEFEVSQTIARSHRGEDHGGIFVPWNLSAGSFARKIPRSMQLERAGLDSATSTKGTELKFTEPGAIIDFLYNTMRVKELGATVVTGLQYNVAFPKQTGKATGSWVAENPGSDVADSNLTLSQVLSSPHTYQSSSSYSRQLLAQAVIDVDTFVRQDLARDMGIAADFAAIAGPTGGSSPVGLMNTTGVQSFVVAADSGNGGAIAYVDVIKMIEALEDVNADQLSDPGWLTTPGIKSDLKLTSRLANTIALPVWGDDDTLGGYMARTSNQVPKTGVRGSTSNNHALILGVWPTMQINMWGSGFELVVDQYRLKKQGMIELTTFAMIDVALKLPQAFVVSQVQK